jgi:hypothetical protein
MLDVVNEKKEISPPEDGRVNPPRYPNKNAVLHCIKRYNNTAPRPDMIPIIVPRMDHLEKYFNSFKGFMNSVLLTSLIFLKYYF